MRPPTGHSSSIAGLALAVCLGENLPAAGPEFVLERFGRGLGHDVAREPKSDACSCNGVRLALGRDRALPEELLVLEANLDDSPGELLPSVIDACLAAGALDAWLTPVVMKKGRPAHVLGALCRPAVQAAVERAIFLHSTTLGVRRRSCRRTALERGWEAVATPWGTVRVKVGYLEGRPVNRAPEFEDCRRLAEQHGVPVKAVYSAALAHVPV